MKNTERPTRYTYWFVSTNDWARPYWKPKSFLELLRYNAAKINAQCTATLQTNMFLDNEHVVTICSPGLESVSRIKENVIEVGTLDILACFIKNVHESDEDKVGSIKTYLLCDVFQFGCSMKIKSCVMQFYCINSLLLSWWQRSDPCSNVILMVEHMNSWKGWNYNATGPCLIYGALHLNLVFWKCSSP